MFSCWTRDQFQGTVWFNFYKGAEAAHFMNKLGYDAMVRIMSINYRVRGRQINVRCLKN